MNYITFYSSPIGKLVLTCDDAGLTGIWFDGEKIVKKNYIEKDTTIFVQTRKWLDEYFKGNKPSFTPPIHLIGSTFQMQVWEILKTIPYGKTITYGEIANKIAKKRGLAKMSAQAVGGAVGRNPISIIIPCHRVVGISGNLTGYAGGLDKKVELLKVEGFDMAKFTLPKKMA